MAAGQEAEKDAKTAPGADRGSKKVIIILPAYNAEKTLERTFMDIPEEFRKDVILVDDSSKDGTVDVAKRLNITHYVHKKNRGYGGNQKTCYTKALEAGADIVVMLHPDYQYDPTLIPEMVAPIRKGDADAVFGSRMINKKRALDAGMPRYKFLGNRFLTLIENIVLSSKLTEFHSGYRAYNRKLLEKVPFLLNSDDFVFDTEIIVQIVHFKFRISEISIPTRYMREASSIEFASSIKYGIQIMKTLWKYLLHKRNFKNFAQFGGDE